MEKKLSSSIETLSRKAYTLDGIPTSMFEEAMYPLFGEEYQHLSSVLESLSMFTKEKLV